MTDELQKLSYIVRYAPDVCYSNLGIYLTSQQDF